MCMIYLWQKNLQMNPSVYGYPFFGSLNVPCDIEPCGTGATRQGRERTRIVVCIWKFSILVWGRVENYSQSLALVCIRISRYCIATRWFLSQTGISNFVLVPLVSWHYRYWDEFKVRGVQFRLRVQSREKCSVYRKKETDFKLICSSIAKNYYSDGLGSLLTTARGKAVVGKLKKKL
jgi:hypothetical protein